MSDKVTVTISRLEQAANVPRSELKLRLVESGKRARTFARIRRKGKFEGFIEKRVVKMGRKIKLPKSGIVGGRSVLKGDIIIRRGAVLENVRINAIGEAEIVPFAVIKNKSFIITQVDENLKGLRGRTQIPF